MMRIKLHKTLHRGPASAVQLVVALCAAAPAFAQAPARSYSLNDLMTIARSDNLTLAAARVIERHFGGWRRAMK